MVSADNSSTHLLLHDGHSGARQQEGLEWNQVPERVLHLVVAVDYVSPGLVDRAEEDCPGWGREDGASSPRTRHPLRDTVIRCAQSGTGGARRPGRGLGTEERVSR